MDIEFKLTTEANAQARLVQLSRLVSSPRVSAVLVTLRSRRPSVKRRVWRRFHRGKLLRRGARGGVGRPACVSSVRSRFIESRRRRAVGLPPVGACCSSDDCGGPSCRRPATTVRQTPPSQVARCSSQGRPFSSTARTALMISEQRLPCGWGHFFHTLRVFPDYARRCRYFPRRQPHNRQSRLPCPELRRKPA